MKKILLISIILFTLINAKIDIPLIKEVNYRVPAGKISYAELIGAKQWKGNRIIIYCNLYGPDSTLVSNNNYFLDTKAPFQLSSQEELDSLISWYKERK